MQAALDGVAAASSAAAAAARRSPAVPLVAASTTALLAGAVLAGGGSDAEPLAWIGAGIIVSAATVLVAGLVGRLPLPDLGGSGFLAVAALAGFAAWAGASIAWSFQPDASWDAFNRGAVYVALVVLGAAFAALVPRAPSAAATLLALLFGLAVLVALFGKVVPALGPDTERSARLHAPVGYWNALALGVAMSLPLWLRLAAPRAGPAWVRAGSVAALTLSLVALVLTGSRGGILVALLACAAWLALTTRRVEGALALALAAVAAGLVSAWALGRPALVEAGADSASRSADGVALGGFLAVAAAAVFAAALVAARADARRPLAPARRRLLGRVLAGGAVAVLCTAAVVGAVRVGDPAAWLSERVREFRNPPATQVTQDLTRVQTFSSNNRWTWWTEAYQLFREHPVVGTGAATFPVARLPIREDTQRPLEPHNLGLRALSETGLVGFALLLAAAIAAVVGVARGVRRLEGGDRAAAAALAASAAAFLAHSLIDMSWEYVAVSAPLFFALGVVLAAGRPPRVVHRRRYVAPVSVAAVALALLASLFLPRLAERQLDAGLDAILAGDPAAAVSHARTARSLNPVAVAPLHLEAAAEEARGNADRAGELYADAVRLQPRNPETWYQLGRFEYEVRRNPHRAFLYLDRAYALDHFSPAGPLLDAVRETLERRGSGG